MSRYFGLRRLATLVALSSASLASFAQTARPSLITANIDETKLVTLAGNTRPEVKTAQDLGRVADNRPLNHLTLQLRRSTEQEAALTRLIDKLHDPASGSFHKWLTATEFGERFGLAQQDLGTVKAWLESKGFTVNVVYPSGMIVDFSGTAGAVRQAFHTELHTLNVKGVQHIANISDPKIPEALAPAVVGITSLNDFRPTPMSKQVTTNPAYRASSSYNLIAPADLDTIYNITPVFSSGITGKGQTIMVVEDTDVYSSNDWTTFRKTFGLTRPYPYGSFTTIHPGVGPGGACDDPGTNGDDFEAILDAEWASVSAPNAAIVMGSCADTDTNFGGYIAMQNVINSSSVPQIISISYGESEAYDGSAFNAYINGMYQQAVSEGVSVFVASGDWGGDVSDANASDEALLGINVNGFGSTIYNVSVGGTDFSDAFTGTTSTYFSRTNGQTYGNAKSYVPEVPWNDSCAGGLLAEYYGSSVPAFCNTTTGANFLNITAGSGGPSACGIGDPNAGTPGVVSGTCAGYPKPSWQAVYGNPSDGVRDLPDVSLFASNGFLYNYYIVCDSDPTPDYGGASCLGSPATWTGGGGTSFAAPIFAGIQALINQKTSAVLGSGNPNPVYYALAGQEYGTSGSSACNSNRGNGISSSCIFNDVVSGDMVIPCRANTAADEASNGNAPGTYSCFIQTTTPPSTYGALSTSNSTFQPAFTTQSGWDFATGLGSVNVNNLVNAFANYVSNP